MVIDVEARMLLKRLQYQAESATISKDDKYLLCNMGQVRTQNIVNPGNILWLTDWGGGGSHGISRFGGDASGLGA